MTKTMLINVIDSDIAPVEPHEIRQVLEAVGYSGVQVLDARNLVHEHPCPGKQCCDELRGAGHPIDPAVVCCICWGYEQSRC